MTIGRFNVSLKEDILIVTTKYETTKDDLIDMKILMESSTGHTYKYGLYRNVVGYYAGYDFELNKSILCGSLKESEAIGDIKKYIKNKSL